MAILLLGATRCSLCDEVIVAGQRTLGTPHFIEQRAHPLWRYSDSSMHYDCFQRWPQREAFVAEYNRTIGQIVWGNGNRHTMQADGTISTARA